MKIFSFFLFISSCVYANPFMEDIALRASQLVDQDAILLDFYNQEINKCDPATLKQNPELVFRRALVQIDAEDEDSISRENFQRALDDCNFVVANAPADSLLHEIAQHYINYINWFLQIASQEADKTPQEAVMNGIEKTFLQQWAPNSTATGKELREEILANFSRDGIPDSFKRLVFLFLGDADLLLGYTELDEFTISRVAQDESGRYLLHTTLKFHEGTTKIELTLAL